MPLLHLRLHDVAWVHQDIWAVLWTGLHTTGADPCPSRSPAPSPFRLRSVRPELGREAYNQKHKIVYDPRSVHTHQSPCVKKKKSGIQEAWLLSDFSEGAILGTPTVFSINGYNWIIKENKPYFKKSNTSIDNLCLVWKSDIYAEVGDDDTDNGDGGSGNSTMARCPMARPLILQTLPDTVTFVHHLLYHGTCLFILIALTQTFPRQH